MKFKKSRGTYDCWGDDWKVRNNLIQQLVTFSIQNGYDPIATPLFEHQDLFLKTAGEGTDLVNKQIFTFLDKKGRPLALRPEGTAPIIRWLIENHQLLDPGIPNKWFYCGPMFRYERPQKGRYRQFYQYGVEVVSDHHSLWTDVEVIKFAHDILKNCGFKNYVCQINFLPTGNERNCYIAALRSQMTKLRICQDCHQRLAHNPLRVLDCKIDQPLIKRLPPPTNFLSADDQLFFEKLQSVFKDLGLSVQVNPFLVRGLDYYNGLVFEFIDRSQPNQLGLTLIGGGHYDQLATQLGSKKPYFAIGFAIGLERLLALVDLRLQAPQKTGNWSIILIDQQLSTIRYAWSIRQIIRQSNGFVNINYNTDQKLKKRIKRITPSHVRYLIFIGEKEVTTKTLTWKLNQTNARVMTQQLAEFKRWFKTQQPI